EAIYMHSPEYPVSKMCKALGVYENQYYRWIRANERRKRRRQAEQELVDKVIKVFKDNKEVYGCKKIYMAINKEIHVSEWKIRKIMRENGLYSVCIKKYKASRGKSKTDNQYSENLLNRQFDVSTIGVVWAGDITYIPTNMGWVYLAAVMDLYNREIIGYQVSTEINTELTVRALDNAKARSVKQEGIIFHSDRGSQYTSKRYQKNLEDSGIRSSMSAPGCPYDNSCMESFFAGLKKECTRRRKYATIEEVKRDLFEYIELFYNRKRLHSTLGYMSPVEYRIANKGKSA
ncbi:MAG: IS3 family transposase, partial [Ruminococcaceae bacterium]|nr:IS3 family transposase [Oscillospiraceae bacterium]